MSERARGRPRAIASKSRLSRPLRAVGESAGPASSKVTWAPVASSVRVTIASEPGGEALIAWSRSAWKSTLSDAAGTLSSR